MSKKKIVIFWVFLSLFLQVNHCVFSESKGLILLLTGPSCSGKSTLSREITKKIACPWVIQKKTALLTELRFNKLEEITGVRPTNDTDYSYRHTNLSEAEKKQFIHLANQSILTTFEEIKEKAKKGKWTIYDSHVPNPEIFTKEESYNLVTILVYASLPDLLKRADHRAEIYQRPPFIQQRTKNTILSAFIEVYSPVTSENQPYLDIVKADEINSFFDQDNEKLYYPNLKKSYLKAQKRFGLNRKASTAIVPKHNYDLVINTRENTVEECVQKIEDFLKEKKIL